MAFGDQHGVLLVERAERNCLRATVRFPDLRRLPTIVARIRRVFDLASDPVAIGAHLGQDPLLTPLVSSRPGLRVPGAWEGFELAVRAILGQQITVSAATRLAARLVSCHGEKIADPVALELGLSHVFPPARQLASADLSTIGMPEARRRTISSMAATVVADPLIFGPRRSLEDAITQLRTLPGIGEWTAQYIAMRELREPDAFPAADIGLLRAMRGNGERRASPAELLAHAEQWRPWRAYAALHLWAADAHAIPDVESELRHEQVA
jgi:AraC family transcriptional regulator of adaptative response / DNA-3-methyladenine glycosylase II